MKTTKIEWTDKTWNPITGCTKLSAGCSHCYAETMSRRLHAMGMEKYKDRFNIALHEECLMDPFSWKKACNIFVCSMSDIFHEQVPFSFIDRIMTTISETPQHRYQILTKRAKRMSEYFSIHEVPKNVWIGVTVEDVLSKNRIEYLRNIPARIHFLSCEPLLEHLGDINLNGIEWVIVGGESGTLARPMRKEWVLDIKSQCEKHRIPFFFKQWGTWGSDGIKRNKHINGKMLNGKIIQEMPNANA